MKYNRGQFSSFLSRDTVSETGNLVPDLIRLHAVQTSSAAWSSAGSKVLDR